MMFRQTCLLFQRVTANVYVRDRVLRMFKKLAPMRHATLMRFALWLLWVVAFSYSEDQKLPFPTVPMSQSSVTFFMAVCFLGLVHGHRDSLGPPMDSRPSCGVRFDGINESGLFLGRRDTDVFALNDLKVRELESLISSLTSSSEASDERIASLLSEVQSLQLQLRQSNTCEVEKNTTTTLNAARTTSLNKPRKPTLTDENSRLRTINVGLLALISLGGSEDAVRTKVSDIVSGEDRKLLLASTLDPPVLKRKVGANVEVLRAVVPFDIELQRTYEGTNIWKKFDYGRGGILNVKFKGIVHYEPNTSDMRKFPGCLFRIEYKDDDDSELVDLPTLLQLMAETPSLLSDDSIPKYVKRMRVQSSTTRVLPTPTVSVLTPSTVVVLTCSQRDDATKRKRKIPGHFNPFVLH